MLIYQSGSIQSLFTVTTNKPVACRSQAGLSVLFHPFDFIIPFYFDVLYDLSRVYGTEIRLITCNVISH